MKPEPPGSTAPGAVFGTGGTPGAALALDANGGGEARLDFVLAEELAVNRRFLERFLEPALQRRPGIPRPGVVTEVRVRLNAWDEGGESCTADDAGENDLDVDVVADPGPLRVLIEDKLWAEFQPDQARRYAARAASRPANIAILVTPERRLDSIAQHLGLFDATHTLEALASWLEDDARQDETSAVRLRWRAQLLRHLATRPAVAPPKPDHPPTVRFTTFCAEWLAEHAPAAIPDRKSLRTAETGWLYFNQPKGLIYKCAVGRQPDGSGSHGVVDLYVADEGFQGTVEDLAAFLERKPAPNGFTAATDTKGNPVVRWRGTPLTPADGLPAPEDRGPLIAALEACRAIVQWRRSMEGSLGDWQMTPAEPPPGVQPPAP